MGKCEDLVHLLSPFFDALREMETLLKCPVCKNLLQDPKLLPCDHIICQHCLPIVDGKQPQCPKCFKFRPKDARSSLFMEEMIKTFNEMDGAISDIFKQIMSNKAPVFEEIETKAIPPDFKETSHGSATSRACKIDEAIIITSVTNDSCNEEKADAIATHAKENLFRKEEFETNRGIPGCNLAGTAESSEGSSEERNSNSSDKGSKSYKNLGNCLNFETKQQEIKSPLMPVNLFHDKCAFCHSSKTTELYGPIVCYLNGTSVKPEEANQESVIYVHQNCLDWAPNVYHSGQIIMNLKEEIERGEKLICSTCGVKGAVLSCSFALCTRSYHVTCALGIDCSWDSMNFKMLCPVHAFKIPKLGEFILV